MQDSSYSTTSTEAVAVFHDVTAFQAAVDDLLNHEHFDHADLSVLASERAVLGKLGRSYTSTRELEDDPDVPRAGYIPDETVGNAKGALIAASAYFPAVLGSLAVISAGATVPVAIAAAVLAGGTGAAFGGALAGLVGRERAWNLQQHIDHGGLLLWVRTNGAEHERVALETLKKHGGEDVHLHVLPRAKPEPPLAVRQPALSLHAH
jgi:hypothetical protein